ncbi:type IV pilus assembly protein PilM [Rarobacter incanus]|uniref:Type IV pilus assembly protein PilM n=1 Tax=Rarobacter incanus TaxID=153494 RepID=A0A542SLU3_9MICO|nr:type IV pilus assembly protein PilM [Rarobacter incanus]TQK75604.1 type IV pilus assembly protein PilM [Rarobacter incanus]
MAKHHSIGLDIGTTAVRAAEIEFGPEGTNGQLKRFNEVALPPDAVRDGEVVDSKVVSAAIKTLFARGGFSGKEVILGVGNQRVAARSVNLPWAPISELKNTLAYQVQDLLPMPVDEALLDFYPIREVMDAGVRAYEGMLVAAAKDSVAANVNTVIEAGLAPVGVDLNAFALLRSMTRGSLGQGNVAMVDIGAKITTVAIAIHGRPVFVRALPVGGQNMTDALARAQGISQENAEQIKCQYGLGAAQVPELRDGAEAMTEIATKLVESIRGTFAYFNTASNGQHLEVVALTGGSAHLPGFGQYLASTSRLNVILGDPFDGTAIAKGAGDAEQLRSHASQMAIAIGLAYGIGVFA